MSQFHHLNKIKNRRRGVNDDNNAQPHTSTRFTSNPTHLSSLTQNPNRPVNFEEAPTGDNQAWSVAAVSVSYTLKSRLPRGWRVAASIFHVASLKSRCFDFSSGSSQVSLVFFTFFSFCMSFCCWVVVLFLKYYCPIAM